MALRLLTLEHLTVSLWGLTLQRTDDAAGVSQFIASLRQSLRSDVEADLPEGVGAEAAIARLLDTLEVIAQSPVGRGMTMN